MLNILTSADPVTLDAVACQVVGIEPLMAPTTRLAHEQGVGVGDLARIELLQLHFASDAPGDGG